MIDLEVSGELRELFKKEAGTVADLKNLEGKIISVGDVTTLKLFEKNIKPDLCIVDFKAERSPISEEEKNILENAGYEKVTLENPAGKISKKSWGVIKKALSQGNTMVIVEGEEDLLAVAALFLAEDGTNILYGRPGEGMYNINVKGRTKQFYAEEIIGIQAHEFLGKINGKTVVLHHSDADGCCSAALFLKYLKKKGIETSDIPATDVIIHGQLEHQILNEEPKFLIVLDFGGEAKAELSKLCRGFPVMVLDHHNISGGVEEFGETLLLNPHLYNVPEDYVAPASYLSYRILDHYSWISAIGCISDKGFNASAPLLKTISKGETELLITLGSMINSADAMGNPSVAVKEIMKCETPEELLDSEKLKESDELYKKIVDDAIEKHEDEASFLKNGEIIFYIVESEYAIRGIVANKLQEKYPEKIIIVGGTEGHNFSMSVRTNCDDLDLPKIIEKSLEGLDGYGGGHKKAAGCKVEISAKDKFIENFIKHVA